MKKLIAAGVIILGAMLSPALAADVPVKATAPMVASSDWSGFYLGAQGGWGRATTHWINAVPDSYFHGGAGFGGLTAGFNWQLAGSPWVWGIETDYSWTHFDLQAPANPGTFESKLTGFGTVRGRLGYAVTPAVLAYATGGWAYGKLHNFFDGATLSTPSPDGWTAGGGVEALFGRNWSAKIEYLHIDLGSPQVCSASGNCHPSIYSPYKLDIVRVGLNYKFSTY